MSCGRYESTCSAATEKDLTPEERVDLEAHATSCAECRGLLEIAGELKSAAGAFSASDPGPAYWVSFSQRLDSRLQGRGGILTLPFTASWRPRFVLALTGFSLLLVSLVAIHRGVPRAPIMGEGSGNLLAAAQRETELLGRLERAEPARLQEALEGLYPADSPPPLEDLAMALSPLAEESGRLTPEDSPYDLFLDLSERERGLLLKEMRGEIG